MVWMGSRLPAAAIICRLRRIPENHACDCKNCGADEETSMRTLSTRRDVMTALAGAGAATVVGARQSAADEGPPETTTVRLRVENVPPNVVNGVVDLVSCNSPVYVAEELLRAEGFTEVRYVPRGGRFCVYAGIRAQ
jgi:hypothetical protein